MKTIINYTIVVAEGVDDLESQVNDLIEKGWQPLGGPFPGGKDMGWLLQALVKFQE